MGVSIGLESGGSLSERGGRRRSTARSVRGWCLVVAIVLASTLGAPDAAHAADPVQTLSAAGRNGWDADVGMDDSGRAVTAWSAFDGSFNRVQARRRTAAGGLGPIVTLSVAGNHGVNPRLAVAEDGDAIVAWMYQRPGVSEFRIQARRISASGALGSIQTLTPPDKFANLTSVDINAAGDAVIAYFISGESAKVQVLKAVGATPPATPLGVDTFHPSAGIDADGDVVAAWVVSDGVEKRVQVRRRTASGTLTSPQFLSAAGQDVLSVPPAIAVEDDGDAVVAWSRSDGSTNRVQTRKRTAAGALSSILTMSVVGREADMPTISMDDDGDAIVAWHLGGENGRIQARRRTSTGELSPIRTLTPPEVDARGPAIAMDGAGDAAISWFASTSPGSVEGDVQARVWRSSGLGAVETLTSGTILTTGNLLDPSIAPVAVSKTGSALAIWSAHINGEFRAQTSRFDA